MKINKSLCGVPRGGFFRKSPLAAGGKKVGPGENLQLSNACWVKEIKIDKIIHMR
jgi:hypothetical protein